MVYLQKCYYGDGRKTEKQKTKQGKNFPVWLPSHPSVYEVEADFFPVSENTENMNTSVHLQTMKEWEDRQCSFRLDRQLVKEK